MLRPASHLQWDLVCLPTTTVRAGHLLLNPTWGTNSNNIDADTTEVCQLRVSDLHGEIAACIVARLRVSDVHIARARCINSLLMKPDAYAKCMLIFLQLALFR